MSYLPDDSFRFSPDCMDLPSITQTSFTVLDFIPAMISLLALSAMVFAVSAAPVFQDLIKGFVNPIIVPSVGGHATCIQGDIAVTASAMNTILNYTSPTSQEVVTETVLEYFQVNSTLVNMVTQGKKKVSGTYNINSKLCFPKNAAPNPSLVQYVSQNLHTKSTILISQSLES